MGRGQRLSFLGVAVLIAVVAVVVLAGGGDDSEPATPQPVLLKAGQEKALNYTQGETVRFRVVSDEPEEVHVHGYDIKQDLEPGK